MDSKVLESQVLIAQSEIQQLKSTLTPCLIFLNEVLDIRKKRNIPDSTTHSVLSLLSLDIKSEIMKEVRPTYATVNQIERVQDRIEETKQDSLTVKELVIRFEEILKSTNTTVSRVEHESRENRDKIEEVRYQLDGKSPLSAIQEIRQMLKGCATLSQLEALKNRLSDCAGKYQMEEQQKNLSFLEKKLKKIPKTKEVLKMVEKVKEEIVLSTEKEFLSNEGFSKEKEGLVSKIAAQQGLMLEIDKKIDRNETAFSKRFSALKKQFDQAPWSSSITEIHNCMLDKANYEDLQKFRFEIDRIIRANSELISSFKKSIGGFEEVIARFDEILLIKAEKDDIYKVNQKIGSLLERNEFKMVTDPMASSIEKIQDAIKKLMRGSDITDKHIDSISAKVNVLVKENIDVSLVAKNLNDLRNVVDHKSNKEDIYEIYDLMARKIEVSHLLETSSLIKKQLELCAVLLLSLCRTLVKNGENQLIIQKTREELLGSLNTLVNWIGGDQPAKLVFQVKKDENEGRRSLSRTFQRRHSSNPDPKMNLDFPKLKMT